MNSEDNESEIEGVWEEVEAACSSIPSLDEPRLHHLAHTLFVVRRYFLSWSSDPHWSQNPKMHCGTTLSRKSFSLKELSLGERQPQAHLWYSPSMKGQTRPTCMPRSWGSVRACSTITCLGVTTACLKVDLEFSLVEMIDCILAGVGVLNRTSHRRMDLAALESMVSSRGEAEGLRESLKKNWRRIKDTTTNFFRNFG